MLAIWCFLLKWSLFRHHVNLQGTKLATRVQTPPISPPTACVCVWVGVNFSPNKILKKKEKHHCKVGTLVLPPQNSDKTQSTFKNLKGRKIPANQWRSLDDISMIHGRKQTIYYFFCPTVLNPDVCTILILKKDPENQHDWLENSNNLKMYVLFNRVVLQAAMSKIQSTGFCPGHLVPKL